MHSGFGLPGIQSGQQQENNPVLLSANPAHILDGAHQLLLNQHHPAFHHFAPAYGSPAVDFRLGLNAINGNYKDALIRGSEQFAGPEARQSSLGMLHCWQNQQDSPNKQTPFWEPLPAEVSNENSEIIDRQEMTQKETLSAACLDHKRAHFGELEAIYKRLGTCDGVQTRPSGTLPVIQPGWLQVPAAGLDHGSEASIGEASTKKRRKKKKRKDGVGFDRIINPMADFFGDLVKQVMDHQEHLQKKFMDVIERLEEERRAREEAWRKQETAHLERKAAVRALEKAQARSREAMIVSYLEKITGERVELPPMDGDVD